MKTLFLTLALLFSVIAVQVQAASLQKTIANINADAEKEGGAERVLKSLSASTHVPVATLEKEKAKTGLSYGDLFAAHSIANASHKSFDQIAALKKGGQTWDKIADDNSVSLDGKKTAKKVAATTPAPSPTPKKKTLAEEQRERWTH